MCRQFHSNEFTLRGIPGCVQDPRAEQQEAASAWNGGHDPYDAGLVTISQGNASASQNGAPAACQLV